MKLNFNFFGFSHSLYRRQISYENCENRKKWKEIKTFKHFWVFKYWSKNCKCRDSLLLLRKSKNKSFRIIKLFNFSKGAFHKWRKEIWIFYDPPLALPFRKFIYVGLHTSFHKSLQPFPPSHVTSFTNGDPKIVESYRVSLKWFSIPCPL